MNTNMTNHTKMKPFIILMLALAMILLPACTTTKATNSQPSASQTDDKDAPPAVASFGGRAG